MKRLIIVTMIVMMGAGTVKAQPGCWNGRNYGYGYGYGRRDYSYGYYGNDTAQIISASSNGVANVLGTMNDAKKWETVGRQQVYNQDQVDSESRRLAVQNINLQRENQMLRNKIEQEKAKEVQELKQKNEILEQKLQQKNREVEDLKKQMNDLQEKMDKVLKALSRSTADPNS